MNKIHAIALNEKLKKKSIRLYKRYLFVNILLTSILNREIPHLENIILSYRQHGINSQNNPMTWIKLI